MEGGRDRERSHSMSIIPRRPSLPPSLPPSPPSSVAPTPGCGYSLLTGTRKGGRSSPTRATPPASLPVHSTRVVGTWARRAGTTPGGRCPMEAWLALESMRGMRGWTRPFFLCFSSLSFLRGAGTANASRRSHSPCPLAPTRPLPLPPSLPLSCLLSLFSCLSFS
jgi:hypothetical protein